MDKKRIIYAAIFVIVCIVIGYAIYRVFFKKQGIPTISTQTDTTGNAFPSVGEGKVPGQIVTPGGELPSSDIRTPGTEDTTQTGTTLPGDVALPTQQSLVTKLVNTKVSNVSAGENGQARFYNQQDGKFYRVDNNGNVVVMSDQVFYNVEQVTWSPASNESIIEYPDGANTYYNFDTQQQITLPSHWEDFTFSTGGEQIAAKSIGLSPENRWLITSDPQGNNVNLIEPLGDNADKVTVDWSPNRQVVALSATGASLGSQRQEILMVGLNHENYKSITVEGRGLESQWSPSGEKLLHSVYNARNNYKPELWIVDATPDSAGENRKVLNVNTWASKCTMSDDRFVYCGVPDSLDTGAGFAPEMANNTSDTLYKIDTQTGIKTEIPIDGYRTIDTIFTSDDGRTLYFTEKNQDGIFEIPIN